MRSKSVQKCSTAQSFTFPKFTSFKLGTLDLDSKCKERYRTVLQILMHRNICAKILIIIDRSNLKSTLVSLKYPSFFILPDQLKAPTKEWSYLWRCKKIERKFCKQEKKNHVNILQKSSKMEVKNREITVAKK